jgi:hypothetical protein
MIPNGAMAYMAGPFIPDDTALWPELDAQDPAYKSDLARLLRQAEPTTEVAHSDHAH